LVLTLLAVTLITLDARGVVALTGPREGAIDAFGPVRGAARWVTTPFRNAWNGMTRYDELSTENERLRGEVDRLEGATARNANAEKELERLSEQLGIDFAGDIPTQIARVTTGPYSNFTDHRLQLDRGTDSELAVGMPVVTARGLVGRIVETSRTRSVVQLITDPDLHIGVKMVDTGITGVGQGGGDTDTFIIDRGIDIGEPVEPNEVVVTGGIERAIMPLNAAIPVGTVDKATPDEAQRVMIVQVNYAVDFTKLDVVQVLKWTPEE
jgi:rod shape-determining protein MreC